ncbi:MAG: hypothetical protein II851_02940 [Bacteroidales bacterium]|nr:hypothetical protein [Bacteroidales bacterium]
MADPRAAEPYYRGTRFDRTGIILDLESGGHRYIQPWQRHYDPFSHDAVSGPAEEFFLDEIGQSGESGPTDGVTQPQRSEDGRSRGRSLLAGNSFVKIGVGLLRREDRPYDRFHLYDILNPGRLTVTFDQALETGAAGPIFGVTQPQRSENGRSRSRSLPAGPELTSATFCHVLDGYYDYVKTVEIPAEGRLRLSHALTNTGPTPLTGHVYCHNFFILDGAPTGRATRFTFPWRPTGDWRAPYDSVHLTDDGIVFTRDLAPEETVFMGNIRPVREALGGVAGPTFGVESNAVEPAKQAMARLNAPGGGRDGAEGDVGSPGAAGDSREQSPLKVGRSRGRSLPTAGEGYRFKMQNLDNDLTVEVSCDRPMDYAVFWSNADVSCLEPYIPFHITPGQTFRWTLDYRFQ